MADNQSKTAGLKKDALWYKAGVIYELHVRAFHDSDGDGTGDFRGLTAKLDYLRDLGVTAIWVLPFYPSPLKDDGYDISDYRGVHPNYGTLGDFKTFLREAHRRELRVITELVVNHTSDQHPWFQRARRSRPGSKWRDYYVWSDTVEKYKGVRIIFKDTEVSNWTWDPVAKAFYWHRFYSHQPDLNFDNPAVHREVFKILDFWMELGVDGVRLDAVPYLYEREGTTCENLPETHAFLKKLRRHVDEKYGDRMLLAEANQWPEEAAAYFGGGKGDECHMAFHFPLMPRLFMALRMEDRVPIVDILQQTPPIPETAQWVLFLRNHDELTLEMVTDEERDYMYRMYAHVRQARLNLGIRRRLAPLVGNDRRRIELLTALLFSLPGTPVIYYGDEIGMGENIYLGDRNGVRTPMQWSADKNAGFSRANPQSLYLPINLDPENHYEAVNVEVQDRNPHSLLWWMKRLIALQKRWKAFGLGTVEFLNPENRKVLAFVRHYQNESILVVANLSRFVQPAELDLAAYKSCVPVELIGRTKFPPIGELPYFLTLGPHSFYWFSLESKPAALAGPAAAAECMALNAVEDWEEILHGRNQVPLEAVLRNWLPAQPWFNNQAAITNLRILEIISLPSGEEKTFLIFLQADYEQSDPEIYALPLACVFGEASKAVCRDWPELVIARMFLSQPEQEGVLYDGIASKAFCKTLLDLISGRRGLDGGKGALKTGHTAYLRKLRIAGALDLEPVPGKEKQNNSLIIYGDRLILKLFRRLEAGVNPDLEINRLLTAQKFPYAPSLAGEVEYHSRKNEPVTVAILATFVPGGKIAWDYTLDALHRFYEHVQTLTADNRVPPPLPANSLTALSALEMPPEVREIIGTYAESARMLGERTAALHLALATETDDPNFAPEPFTAHSQRGVYQSMRNLMRRNFHLLDRRLADLAPDTRELAQQVLALEPAILKQFRMVYERSFDAARIRHHGDYHLGQVLYTGKDFLIVDFEGDPALALSERRLKRSPLRDVASMVQSFRHAAHTELLKQLKGGTLEAGQLATLTGWARFWSRWINAVFLRAYRQAAKGAVFLPASDADWQVLMDIYLLRKAIGELGGELNDRPEWVKASLQIILESAKQGQIT